MKSHLYHNEEGNIRAQDVRPCNQSTPAGFTLPASPIARAELFVAAQKREQSTPALRVRLGETHYSLDTPHEGRVCWLRTSLNSNDLRAGENVIEVLAQDGWSLAHDAASREPVVRLRTYGDEWSDDIAFPRYGDTAIEAQRDEWLNLLPESMRQLDDRWQWCWNLAGYLSAAWPYANEFQASSYAPWDARTILKWGRAGKDDHGEKPIVMCVHYAVCFVQFCIAMGIPARAVVLAPGLDSSDGHFVPEVWLEEWGAWAMLDPNLHLCYRDASTLRPLAVAELFGRSNELPHLVQFGAGWESQESRLQDFGQKCCLSGEVYRLWGVWGRHDWIAQPDQAPPAHGAVLYAETDILWCAEDEATRSELAMFPHFLSPAQVALPPNQS